MNYAVVFTYSFDDEMAVYLFEDESSAKDFLISSYEEELRIDKEENGRNPIGVLSDDGWYAKITTPFFDHEDITEFRIGCVCAKLSSSHSESQRLCLAFRNGDEPLL